MDTLQLATENSVKIFTLKKGIKDTIIYDKKEVEKRFGFGPKHIIDYKGLAGDPSDNIPGIKGIGVKTATTLITNFGSIEEIYEKLESNEDAFKEIKITPRIINLLKDGKEEAYFSKALATIKIDVPDIDFYIPKKTFSETIDFSKTGDIFRKFQFRSLNERLQKSLGVDVVKAKTESFDQKTISELKLAISLLNTNITEPTIDDILIFGKDQKESLKVISEEISKKNLDFV
jgi:DNA polymerase-1